METFLSSSLPMRNVNVFADGSFEVGVRDNIDGFEIAGNSEFGYLLPDWIDEGNKEKETKNEGDAISETPKAKKSSWETMRERERVEDD